MRQKLRKIYETNNASLGAIYLFLKICFIIFGRYKRFKEETNEAIKTFEGDNISLFHYKKTFMKLIVYRYIYYLRAGEYYLYNFDKVPYDKRDSYMTRQLTNRYYAVINTKRFRKVLDKKNLSYKVFKNYYKRDLICINDEEEINKFYNFLKNKKSFILKPFSGHSGDGIEIINTKDFKSKKELFNYTLEKAPYVAEELINQDDGLGCFHKESVNTTEPKSIVTNGSSKSIISKAESKISKASESDAKTSKKETTTAQNKSNNYLSSLKIKNHAIDFNKDKLEYNIYVKDEENKLTINAKAEDTNANIKITLKGNTESEKDKSASLAEEKEDTNSIDARLTKVLEGKGLTIEDFYGYVYDSGTTPSAFMRIAEGYDGNLERLVNLTIEAAEENAPDSSTPTMSAGIENVNIAEPQGSSSDDSYPDWLQPVDPSASMNALMNALGAASGTVSDTALSWEAVNQNESQQSWLDEQQSGDVTASRIDKWYLAAGTVVPITIVTGIDTDLPGDVVGVVRQNVYDTLTGRNLLIPKGSRLIAAYNNSVAFGQKSVQIAWNQLILPDGYVFTLPGFQGVTGEGYAGNRDRYNSHFWEMLGGALLGTIIDYSTGYVADQAELASEVITGSDILSVLANSALGTSQSYMEDWIQLHMNRQPTIKIRPGYQTQLLVNQNISLKR